ncbi:hypothetical protein BGZ76_011775 [Entomortierella beljakovae]|nr:hypothetical protein BGZ76_011775 [Entomortierella beljakovae]
MPGSHNIYNMGSATSSTFSLASSQFSIEKVNYAFGSLPPPCPVNSFSLSSSSLPLNTSKDQILSSPTSLTSRNNRIQPQPQLSNYQRKQSISSINSEISLAKTISSLPPTGKLPPRKRISSGIPPPLDIKAFPHPTLLSPSLVSSRSAAMSSTSPCSVISSPADGNIYSEVSSVSGSGPSTPTQLKPIAGMAITDLVMSEAQYLTIIKRVVNALNQVTERNLATGRKESVALRSLIDRWNEMIRIHARFHDDIISNENLRETAALINSLLVALEPILIDHSRELSNSLKKLTRRDQNSEHTFAEWDSALRKPFEHLTCYDEWLHRIDPQSMFCEEYRSQLNGVIYKIRVAAETAPQPRNMLRRLSTMARGVMRRRSSVQTVSFGSSIPHTPTTPDTPPSTCTTQSGSLPSPIDDKFESCSLVESHSSSVSLPLPETVQELAITENEQASNAVMESVFLPNRDSYEQSIEKELPAVPDVEDDLSIKEPATPIADTFLAPVHAARQLQHRTSTLSELSSSGTLANEAAPSVVSSSASSVYSKSSSSAETLQGKTAASTSSSLARQSFLAEKDHRKATLRIGAGEIIQAKTESLQSPTFFNTTSVETLRRVAPIRNSADKPPVKSLINFWEQVSDPLELDA